MKKFFLMLGMLVAGLVFAADNEIIVTVSADGSRVTKKVKTELTAKAKKAAVAKYVKNNYGGKVGGADLDKVLSEAEKFVEDDLETEEDPSAEDGEVTAKYKAIVKPSELATYLAGLGVDLNATADGTRLEIFVMEEAPDAGQLKLGDEVGNFFFDRYGMFQRRIRGKLVKAANDMGFDVVLLEDNENYEEFKKKDPNLVGVYYDVNTETRGFAVTPNFLKTVQESNPDAIALYYRIDALDYDAAKHQIRVSVALSLKTLSDNTTEDVGTKDYQFPTTNTKTSMVMADIGTATETAMASLLNGEGMREQLQGKVKKLMNRAKKPKGPKKLVINCSQVDSKIKIKFRVALKKALIEAGLTNQASLKIVKDTLSCTVTKTDIGDLDELWVEVSEKITELLGDDIEVTDDWAKKNGDTLTVTIGK